MEAFLTAVQAVIDGDAAALAVLLARTPGLVREPLRDERFVPAIVHQLYAGDTLLHVAAAGFHADVAQALIGAGADIAARNRRGATPLHYAADANRDLPAAQAATLSVLLQSGSGVDAADKGGITALHRAVRTRSSAAVKVLLGADADPNRKTKAGSSPLHLALRLTGRGTPEARAQQAAIVALLLKAGADPQAVDGKGVTASTLMQGDDG